MWPDAAQRAHCWQVCLDVFQLKRESASSEIVR
jgi:hypothetical protein